MSCLPGVRLSTFFLHVQTPEMGGATVFPDLGIKAVWKSAVIRTTSGAKVSPPCYNLIYFHSMNYSYIMLYPPQTNLKVNLAM